MYNQYLFVDYKRAYDFLERKELWVAMETLEIPITSITLIRPCIQNAKSRSMVMLSKDFNIKTGLRRRDALPSVLFSIALESVVAGRFDTDVGISVQNNINSMCRPFGVYRRNRGGSQDSSRITNKEK